MSWQNKVKKTVIKFSVVSLIFQLVSCGVFPIEPSRDFFYGKDKNIIKAGGGSIATPFGVNAHIKQRYYNERATAFTKMTTAGMQWAREQFTWNDIEPSDNNWQYGQYDTLATDYETNNVQALGLLGYSANWASTGYGKPGADKYLPNLTAWADFISHTVERYDGDGINDAPGSPVISDWELWNEPNHENYFIIDPGTGGTTYYWYGQLLKRGYQAAKAANPNVNVVFGGTSGSDVGFLKNVVDASGGVYFDTFAIHPYRNFSKPEDFYNGDDTLQYQIGQAVALAQAYGNKPVWLTEIGWNTDVAGVTEELKANYLARTFAIGLSIPNVEKIFVYDLKDAGDSFGLTNSSWSDKTSYNTYKTIISKLNGATFNYYDDVIPTSNIDNFENGVGWTTYRFNGSTGSVARVGEHYGGSAGLEVIYNHDYINPSSSPYTYLYKPVSLGSGNPVVGMMIKGNSDFNLVVRIRLRDATGEVFQGTAVRSPYSYDWQHVTVNFNNTDQRIAHWGGDNDGVLDGNITFEGIIFDKINPNIGSGGIVYIDNVNFVFDSNNLHKYVFSKNYSNIITLWSSSGSVVKNVNVGSNSLTQTTRDGSTSNVVAPSGILNHNFTEGLVYFESPYASVFSTKSNNSNIIMNAGDTASVWMKFINLGNSAWYGTGSGNTPKIYLTTDNPVGKNSDFADISWVSSSRPVMLDESSRTTGQVGTFTFTLKAPSGKPAGIYREYLRPVADQTSDMNSSDGAYLDILYIPQITSASELNDLMDPRTNPSGFNFWWDYGIPNNTTYRDWFFTQIVPNNSYIYSMLWDKAVPQLWTNAYYYTYLFDHAIPDKLANSFYYTRFWNKAVPEYWTWGFYYKRLWDKAIPENWVPSSPNSYRTTFWTLAVPSNWANSYYSSRLWNKAVPEGWSNHHYYSYFFDTAVPSNLASEYYYNTFWNTAVPNLWVNGYYYSKLWDKAVPQDWVPESGPPGTYSYKWTFWIKAVPNNWSSSFYERRLWDRAIPQNWVSGYYTTVKNQAATEDWASGYYSSK